MKQLIYIIIPVHNRKALTLACLENLKINGDLQKYYVIVVDDGSSDRTSEEVAANYPEVIILRGDGNLWWTGAIALGMKYAYEHGAEYLIWLNDDCQLSDRVLDDLVDFALLHQNTIIGCQGMDKENPEILAFGGKRKTWQGYRFIHMLETTVTKCELLSGNVVCLPRSAIAKIGYPDSIFTPHYGGDTLYLIRAQKAGFTIYVDNRNLVYSLHGESKLYPQNLILQEGKPLDIVQLVFTPQSGLSWRIWLKINWEAYSLWGIIMFFKKYLSIVLITCLRFLPINLRRKLF
jgi:GT2 family glycosyltransferase